MKRVILAMFLFVALVSCDSPNRGGTVYVNSQPTQDVYVTPQVSNLGDNLDLQALGELVKTAKSAQDLENQLNVAGSINNLDLDGDGKVDYIKVTEYGDGNNRGFSFTVDLANGEQQEVATVELQKNANQQVVMNINGNNQIYGSNSCSYSSHYSLTDLMIMSYLFSPHRVYFSPYHYGYYPSYYHSYAAAPYTSYSSRVKTVTKTTRITKTSSPRTSTIKSPNSNLSSKSVNTRAKSFSSPTRSQKSFAKTSVSNSRPNTSGFGSSRRSSISNSSNSSRSSSFGSSRSSSSSSSRSSSRSFGSSSRSSSRSSFGGSRSSSSRRSDARFKANIAPLTNSLDKVCSLKGVSYDWKAKEFPAEKFNSKKQIGFLAQDLEKVYPAVVNTRADGYKTVDYDLLVPALVEAIKELKASNAKQDSIINVLTGNRITVNK